MVGDKYRHTFHLVGGGTIVAYSSSEDLSHITFGRETSFLASDDEKSYIIPFFSVDHIEIEEIEN